MLETCAADRKDLASNKLTCLVIWGLPMAAIVATSFVDHLLLLTVVWTASWTEMGIACLVNAFRCGRLHCYLTGPFFLLGGAASLLHGLNILLLGPHGWSWIGITMLVGGILLTCLPEWKWGRYISRST